MKFCDKHQQEKEWQVGSKRWRCSACNVEAVTQFRSRRKQKAVDYKGGCCSKCGYDRYIGALEFHHLDPMKKDLEFGANLSISWEKTKKELDKCILVCSNCHREIHRTDRLMAAGLPLDF